ncbi:MAG: hypothetical protein JWM11_970 [Planctomycetaceae bacterium]|nr:hypothetical protein [Planctomycetaceae bacterium]
MTSNATPRRGRRSNAGGTRTANVVPTNAPASNFPDQAWIIVEQNWEHNDEFFVPKGESAHLSLYYSETEAQTECQRLNDEFFAQEPSDDYLDEMETYLEPDSYDPDEITWDQLRAAGYGGPFRVRALHTPNRKPPP